MLAAPIALRCNRCSHPLSNKAFKLSCNHVLCEDCLSDESFRRARRCPVCEHSVASGDILEFQVVGSRINDDQLGEVRATLQAIAAANGTGTLEAWLQMLRQFEHEQLLLAAGHYERMAGQAQREAQAREQEWTERMHNAEQTAAQLELRYEQMRNERDQEARMVREAQAALEERTRQADKWKSLYDQIKHASMGSSGSTMPDFQQQQQAPLLRASSASSTAQSPVRSKFVFPLPRSSSEMPVRSGTTLSMPSLGSSNVNPVAGGGLGFHGNGSNSSNTPASRNFSALPIPSATGFARGSSSMTTQVRSSFFTPQSLRGVSPSVRKLNHFPRGGGSGEFGGGL